MKWVLKQLLLLAVTLTLSTFAAGLVKLVTTHGERPLGKGGEVARYSRVATGLPDAPVEILAQPQPVLTDEALRDGIGGTVELKMTLNWDGTISNIMPVKRLPAGLTEQAVKVAQQIRFRPAIVNGQFTNAEQIVEYHFWPPTESRGALREQH